MSETFTEPITVAEVMSHCRILSADEAETAKINAFISAAREYAEGYCGTLFGVRTVSESFADLSDVDGVSLGFGPLVSLTSIEAQLADGTTSDLTSHFQIDHKNDCLVGKNLPAIDYAETLYPVTVTLTAGKEMPAMVRQACLLIIGHWYENREDVVVGIAGNSLPMAARALLDMQRHTQS